MVRLPIGAFAPEKPLAQRARFDANFLPKDHVVEQDYCGLDTSGMVEIVEALRRLVAGGRN
jgi:hypothetical protein